MFWVQKTYTSKILRNRFHITFRSLSQDYYSFTLSLIKGWYLLANQVILVHIFMRQCCISQNALDIRSYSLGVVDSRMGSKIQA